jgi:hypothetical protein
MLLKGSEITSSMASMSAFWVCDATRLRVRTLGSTPRSAELIRLAVGPSPGILPGTPLDASSVAEVRRLVRALLAT